MTTPSFIITSPTISFPSRIHVCFKIARRENKFKSFNNEAVTNRNGVTCRNGEHQLDFLSRTFRLPGCINLMMLGCRIPATEELTLHTYVCARLPSPFLIAHTYCGSFVMCSVLYTYKRHKQNRDGTWILSG